MRIDVLKKHIEVVAAMVFIFLTVAALLLDSRGIRQYTNIFYWPFGINLLFWMRCIPLPIALISIIIWARKHKDNLKRSRYFIVLSITLILLLGGIFFQYFGIWVASSVWNVGTVQFEEKTYHVAEVSQFDERNEYFLGKCEKIRYWCEFHPIFLLNAYADYQVEFSANSDHISLQFLGEEVYKFDGTQEICVENDIGFCIEN